MLAGLADFGSVVDRWAGEGSFLATRGRRSVEAYLHTGSSQVVAADARLTNRAELVRQLGRDATLPDCAIVAAAWTKWDVEAPNHLVGDYAFAVWDLQRRRLTLTRSPIGARPLFYSRTSRRFAFATLPWALGEAADDLAPDGLADLIAHVPRQTGETIYRGIASVRPGHMLHYVDGEVELERFWYPSIEPVSDRSFDEIAEGLRETLRSAVARDLSDVDGPVAAQLSSGRDSSAVLAETVACLAGRGRELLALTGAPASELTLPTLGGERFDESGVASETAALYPSVRHKICRPRPPFPLDRLVWLNRLNQFPAGIASNLPWQIAILDAARDAGATVLLNGQLGNATISLGGPDFIDDVRREEGAGRWLQSIVCANMGLRPAAAGIAEALTVRRALVSWVNRHGALRNADESIHLLNRAILPSLAHRATQLATADASRGKAALVESLLQEDQAHIVSETGWGLASRDPTADRRLIEYCLRIPARFLLSRGNLRPLYARAFAGRVAPVTLTSNARGYQGADWFLHFPRNAIRDFMMDRIDDPCLAEIIDRAKLDDLFRHWPDAGFERTEIYRRYRMQLLTAVSVAAFLEAWRARPRLTLDG